MSKENKKDEILVKYCGKSVPFMGGKQIFPGVQGVDREAFEEHVNTPLGKSELEKNIWVVMKKPVEKKSSEEVFADLPVSKQRELIEDMFDVKELAKLKNDKKIGVASRKFIEDRIEELTSEK